MPSYELEGRYSLSELFAHLESHPEQAYSFISKCKSGLEKITSPGLRKIFEDNETKLFYDFNDTVMKIGFRGK